MYSGEVSVQNLSYDKHVTIHYTFDGQNWIDTPATYVKADPNNPGYKVWSFNFNVNNGGFMGDF